MNEIQIQALTMDSREVKPHGLFIALAGTTVDGRDYIEDALKKGAAAVLVEENGESFSLQVWQAKFSAKFFKKVSDIQETVPIIPVSQLRKITGVIASRFFDEPSKKISVIGVTGTNGKTSTTHYIAQILNFLNRSCGVIGTLGAGFLDCLENLSHTTPDSIMVHQKLFELHKQKAKTVAMEVSSHALDQYRVSGVQFKTAIFTNLTRDHLDYHPTLEAYAQAKQKLFCSFEPQYSVINLDDEQGHVLIEKLELKESLSQIIGYTIYDEIEKTKIKPTKKEAKKIINKEILFITTHHLVLSEQGIKAWIKTPWGEGELNCALLGAFNLSNLLAAIAAVCLEGVSFEDVLLAANKVKPVLGRMMRLGGMEGAPLVVVDYAHTPDALKQVLAALRPHCHGKLWCVFGCGGDRDKGKRALMGAIAENLCDSICITQDNPRTEDPNEILNDIIQGLKNPEKALLEPDRRLAIERVIGAANTGDCILVAGKGHEDYQIVGDQKIPFSDLVEVKSALEKRKIR